MGVREDVELYDVLLDPHETNNLSQQDQYQSILKELSRQLDDWLQHANEPFYIKT